MELATKEHLTDRNIWVRGLYMAFFALAYAVAEMLVVFVAVFQFVVALVTGSVNAAALKFGANLSAYITQILRFVTFNDEQLPFPFADWPDAETGDTPWAPEEPPARGDSDTSSARENATVEEAPEAPDDAGTGGDETPPSGAS